MPNGSLICDAYFYSFISFTNSFIPSGYYLNKSPALSDGSVFFPYIQFPVYFGASTKPGCNFILLKYYLLQY